jgi:NADH dehydrogenase (ubiquinone) 1 beta subcomplex subunit 5
MVIMPSKYQWQKYKDSLHFYLFLGAIPLLGIVFFANVFIGPATLSEVPSNYVPKHWEYYKVREEGFNGEVVGA